MTNGANSEPPEQTGHAGAGESVPDAEHVFVQQQNRLLALSDAEALAEAAATASAMLASPGSQSEQSDGCAHILMIAYARAQRQRRAEEARRSGAPPAAPSPYALTPAEVQAVDGCVRALIGAARAFPRNDGIQYSVCAALCRLAGESPSNDSVPPSSPFFAATAFAVESHEFGLETLAAAARAFPAQPAIQADAFGVLVAVQMAAVLQLQPSAEGGPPEPSSTRHRRSVSRLLAARLPETLIDSVCEMLQPAGAGARADSTRDEEWWLPVRAALLEQLALLSPTDESRGLFDQAVARAVANIEVPSALSRALRHEVSFWRRRRREGQGRSGEDGGSRVAALPSGSALLVFLIASIARGILRLTTVPVAKAFGKAGLQEQLVSVLSLLTAADTADRDASFDACSMSMHLLHDSIVLPHEDSAGYTVVPLPPAVVSEARRVVAQLLSWVAPGGAAERTLGAATVNHARNPALSTLIALGTSYPGCAEWLERPMESGEAFSAACACCSSPGLPAVVVALGLIFVTRAMSSTRRLSAETRRARAIEAWEAGVVETVTKRLVRGGAEGKVEEVSFLTARCLRSYESCALTDHFLLPPLAATARAAAEDPFERGGLTPKMWGGLPPARRHAHLRAAGAAGRHPRPPLEHCGLGGGGRPQHLVPDPAGGGGGGGRTGGGPDAEQLCL